MAVHASGPAPAQLAKNLRRAALASVVGGTLAAALIYWRAVNRLPEPDLAADRGYAFALARIGGNAALHIAQFDRWFASLWHGTALAGTVAVLGLLLAALCWWLAELLGYPLPPEEAGAAGDRP